MKMKGMIIIGGIILVSLSACDKLTDMVTAKGWEYTTKVDKLTQEQSVSAKKEFVDKNVDFVRTDVNLTCTNNQRLYAAITTYDTRPDKDGNLSGATMSYDSDKINLIETRSGKNPINYLIALPDFSNELIFNVAHPDDGATLLLVQLAILGIDIPKESASLMVGSHWIIRVNTKLGNPTITVDLNDPIVKKVTSQCKWKPAFSSSNPTEKMNSSNEIEKGYIQTKATFLGYAERDWGCTSDFIINGKKVAVEGCPKGKMIYENNKGKALTLTYKTGMVEGFKTYYFVDIQE